ncbi:MAG: hypothetical protein FWG47_05200 [Propionibacteriaceae bacterium]|nr:hypothetical protein [Propionibacteriaceae bacterium]
MEAVPKDDFVNLESEVLLEATSSTEAELPFIGKEIVTAYQAILRTNPIELTNEQQLEQARIEAAVREAEHASQVGDEQRGSIDQQATGEIIVAAAVLFRERFRALAKTEEDEDTRDLLLEIPKLMGEYLQSVTQHESALVTANLLSSDVDTYQQRISNYDRSRRGKHQALMTRINMAVRSARGHGIEPLIYREVSKDVGTADRYTIAEYSRNVLSLYS